MIIQFRSCAVEADYEKGCSISRYPDGAILRSEDFNDQTAWDYGYGSGAGLRFSAEHDIIHHFLAEFLSFDHSVNHWLLAHNLANDLNQKARELEEALVSGFTFKLNQSTLPFHNERSWTRVPEIYITYAEMRFWERQKSLRSAVLRYDQLIKRARNYGKATFDE